MRSDYLRPASVTAMGIVQKSCLTYDLVGRHNRRAPHNCFNVYTYALSTRALVSIDSFIANPVFIVESDTSAFALSRNAGIEALIGL